MNILKNESTILDLLIGIKENRPFTIENKHSPITDVSIILIQLPLTQNIRLNLLELVQLQNILNEIENIQTN